MTLFKVTIPRKANVLVLEDSPMRQAWFASRLPDLKIVASVDEFLAYFDTKPLVDFIFYDHDLGSGKPGVEAAKFIAEQFGTNCKWGLIHSWNGVGAKAIQQYLPNIVHIPFGDFEIEIG